MGKPDLDENNRLLLQSIDESVKAPMDGGEEQRPVLHRRNGPLVRCMSPDAWWPGFPIVCRPVGDPRARRLTVGFFRRMKQCLRVHLGCGIFEKVILKEDGAMTVGGSVFNQSTKNLIVAYNDESLPGKPFRYTLLKAGDRTPGMVDVDGFRGEQDNVGIIFKGSGETWKQWWRIRGLTVATVMDDGLDLKFITVNDFYLFPPQMKTDADFEWAPPGTVLKPFP